MPDRERKIMKKNSIKNIIVAAAVAALVLSGCGAAPKAQEAPAQEAPAAEAPAEEAAEAEQPEAAKEEAAGTEEAAAAEEPAAEEAAPEEAAPAEEAAAEETDIIGSLTDLVLENYAGSKDLVRVGGLKGPTTMGILNLMKASEEGKCAGNYEFTMETQPDEIAARLVGGDLDIAMIPANLASVLYNKTEGGIAVLDVNTLGVLYCVSADESISSVKDLEGKTILMTGQGATPEYSVRYLMNANGITDYELEFHSEATEIAAILAEEPEKIAVLPQPFVTVALAQNESLKSAFSLSDEWDAVSGGSSRLITGVTVVRKAFLEEHKEAVIVFEAEHAKSVGAANSDPAATGVLCEEYGIVAKAGPATKAIPNCNLVCITGDEMKTALSGYLATLFEQEAKSVGGKLPQDDFYYDIVRNALPDAQ